MGGSSSGRRRTTRGGGGGGGGRGRRKSAGTVEPGVRVLAFEEATIVGGMGFSIMQKSGWVPGAALGAGSPDARSPGAVLGPVGRSAPLPITVKRGRAGIGAYQPLLDAEELIPRAVRPASYSGSRGLDWGSPGDVMDIFDPLRPKCRFDTTHVVANLKALRKHELSCPSNPERNVGRRAVPIYAAAGPAGLPASLPTHFSHNHLAQMHTMGELEPSASEDEGSIMSDMSSSSSLGSLSDADVSGPE